MPLNRVERALSTRKPETPEDLSHYVKNEITPTVQMLRRMFNELTDQINSGSLVGLGPLRTVALGTTVALGDYRSQRVHIDASGAAATVVLPAAPTDGDAVWLKRTSTGGGNSVVSPGTATARVEDPAGTGLGLAGASVALTTNYQAVLLAYDAAADAWRQYA